MKEITRSISAICVSAVLISTLQAEEIIYEDSSIAWQYSEYLDTPAPADTAQPAMSNQQQWQPAQQPTEQPGYENTGTYQPQSFDYGATQYPQAVPPGGSGYADYAYQEGSAATGYEQPVQQPPVSYNPAPVAAPAVPAPTPAAAPMAPEVLGERLLSAARNGQLSDVRWLLRKGADPEYKAHANALSPLDLVVKGGWVDVAQVFQEEGVNFNRRGSLGVTFLHQAAAAGRLPMVKFLISAGLSPNTTTAKDWTALHHAARFGHADVVDYLLAVGANPEHRNSDGLRPRELAINARHIQIARMF